MIFIEDELTPLENSFETCERMLKRDISSGNNVEVNTKILEDIRKDFAERVQKPYQYFSYRKFIIERLYHHTPYN